VRSREQWQAAAAVLERARRRGELSDEDWFSGMRAIFDAAYTAAGNPRAQSGFGGDAARWEAGRRPVAHAIDRPGSFLDIGCANGHLLECLVAWSPHPIEPYGLDLAPAVAELARERLPQWRERIHVGNALTWVPRRRFDFVRTELVYVPDDLQPGFVRRLLDEVVDVGGRLIVCGYGSPRSGLVAHPVGRVLRAAGFEPELEYAAVAPEGGGAIVEVAVLRAPTWDGRPVAAEDPRAVSVVVWRRTPAGREYLLLHRRHHGPDYVGDWAWTPPSGARQPGEEPEAAARRELLEETGLDLPLRAVEHATAEVALYVAEAPADAEVRIDAEHDAYAWVTADEAAVRCLPAVVGDSVRTADRALDAAESP
jgi:8-oxo-dGTP pyrophosphatase MutT (NUDIX family)